jgi:hypothetical protein
MAALGLTLADLFDHSTDRRAQQRERVGRRRVRRPLLVVPDSETWAAWARLGGTYATADMMLERRASDLETLVERITDLARLRAATDDGRALMAALRALGVDAPEPVGRLACGFAAAAIVGRADQAAYLEQPARLAAVLRALTGTRAS